MKRNRYTVLLCGLACSLLACQLAEKETESTTNRHAHDFQISQAQFEQNQMQLISMEEAFLEEHVSCSGTIDVPPQNRAKITAIMGGYVKESPLLVGDEVKKGEVLITLENPAYIELQEAYLQAQADVDYLKVDYERQADLQKDKINSTKDFQKVESEWQKAKAKKKGLAEQLALIGINADHLSTENISAQIQLKSPINGTIAMVNISKGTYVNPTEALMEILDTDHLHLELEVFEKDVLKVKKQQEIVFRLTELGSEKRRGEVHLIGNLISAETRSLKVHGHLDDLDSLQLAVGMFVEAKIKVGQKKALRLPASAVYKLEGKHFLLMQKASQEEQLTFERQSIEVWKELEDFVYFKAINNNELMPKVLSGAYHFVGEEEEGGHAH